MSAEGVAEVSSDAVGDVFSTADAWASESVSGVRGLLSAEDASVEDCGLCSVLGGLLEGWLAESQPAKMTVAMSNSVVIDRSRCGT